MMSGPSEERSPEECSKVRKNVGKMKSREEMADAIMSRMMRMSVLGCCRYLIEDVCHQLHNATRDQIVCER